MALDLRTKASIRRHLGLPAAGINTANTTMGLRTVTRAGQLEFYMNNLQVEEEALLLGRPYGAFLLTGPVVNGTVYTIHVNAATVTYTAGPLDVIAPSPLVSVASNLRQALVNAVNNILTDQAVIRQDSRGSDNTVQVSLQSLGGTFTLTGTNVTILSAGDAFPTPQYQVDDGNGNPANAKTVYGLLPVCDALEQQVLAAAQNLTFSEVGSRTTGAAMFRPDEIAMRQGLLRQYRYELGVMLSFYQPNPQSGIPGFGIRV